MNFRNERSSRNMVVLEVTPLVDIVFLLLIFFLLTATYVKNPYLDINLPEASLNKVTNHKKDIDIGVAEDGELKYNNENVSIEKLESLLRAEFAANAEAVIVIRADKSSTHGRVVDVMDLAKRIGFNKLAIAIQAKTGAM
jgi:biopolymer transport protein ExbD